MSEFFSEFAFQFEQNLITADRWKMLLEGLGVTVEITIVAIVIGTVLGFLLAFMKMSKLRIFRIIANVYIEIIRGTPTTVQLLIIYFVILAPKGVGNIAAAMVAFGLNSAAYVAEIVRAGVEGVDKGQIEADARSVSTVFRPL